MLHHEMRREWARGRCEARVDARASHEHEPFVAKCSAHLLQHACSLKLEHESQHLLGAKHTLHGPRAIRKRHRAHSENICVAWESLRRRAKKRHVLH